MILTNPSPHCQADVKPLTHYNCAPVPLARQVGHPSRPQSSHAIEAAGGCLRSEAYSLIDHVRRRWPTYLPFRNGPSSHRYIACLLHACHAPTCCRGPIIVNSPIHVLHQEDALHSAARPPVAAHPPAARACAPRPAPTPPSPCAAARAPTCSPTHPTVEGRAVGGLVAPARRVHLRASPIGFQGLAAYMSIYHAGRG